jgi:hypothetical protein
MVGGDGVFPIMMGQLVAKLQVRERVPVCLLHWHDLSKWLLAGVQQMNINVQGCLDWHVFENRLGRLLVMLLMCI